MSRGRRRQMRLPFEAEVQVDRVPEEARRRCRSTLGKLLIQVLSKELQGKEAIHEREDPTDPS
jgi:hypothetical protein